MKRFYLYAPAGETLGLGHLRRMLALAEGLRTYAGVDPVIVTGPGSDAPSICARRGLKAVNAGIATAVETFRTALAGSTWVLDTKEDVTAPLALLREAGARICLVDNHTDARFMADIAVYPVEHLADELEWKGFTGKLLQGVAYFPLDPSFVRAGHAVRHLGPRVVVSFGGADPNGLTEMAVEALRGLEWQGELWVVLGPFFRNGTGQVAAGSARLKTVRQPADVAEIMAGATLAVTAFGITLYELAYLGVPAVFLNNFPEDEREARRFAALGTAVGMGYYAAVGVTEIRRAVEDLLKDGGRRALMAQRGRRLVDGRGVERLVAALCSPG